ncbi:MAG: hypothetical protein IJV38_05875 [Prevotella sp.]|nr:hypothetical protein [Prevotella sp.]
MKKILYIQIDNKPLPEKCAEDIEVLDCQYFNDFCSFVGDALVGDLKDAQGTSLYRLINPVGNLLYDFKEYNPEAYEGIQTEWYRILADILQKGFLEGKTTAKLQLPLEYVDWLASHDNKYYAAVGKDLQERGNVVVLDSDLFDTIIPNIINKIKNFHSEHKDNIEIIVFSNYLINQSSYIAKELFKEIEDLPFLSKFHSLSQWEMLLHKKELEQEFERKERELLCLRERIERLDDCKAFRIDDYILGETKPTGCEQTDGRLNYKGGEIKIVNGIRENITAKKGTEAFQILASCILKTDTDVCSVSFDAIRYHLSHFGFKAKGASLTANMKDRKTAFLVSSNVPITVGIGAAIALNPAILLIANMTGQIVYKETLLKETNDFICELKFYSANAKPGYADKLDYRRNMPNTLDEISVCVKHIEE